jgi:tetratricopeptide (TPR) repeat protein
LIVVCLLASAAGGVAWAGNPLAKPVSREARGHLDRGNKLYNLGSFEEAIVEYKAGALIEQVPVFDYNLGQANRQLGNYRDALWHYDRFLANGRPVGKLRDAVISFMAEMRTHLANKAQTMPPTDPAPASGASPPTVSQPSLSEQQRGRVPNDALVPGEDRDWVGWSLSAAGVVGLGTAGYLFVHASQLSDQVALEQDQQRRNQLRSGVHTNVVAGTITASAGAALVIAGVIRLALHRDERARRATWAVTATSGGVMVLGSF